MTDQPRDQVQARSGGTLPVVPETIWLSPSVPEPDTGQLWAEECVS